MAAAGRWHLSTEMRAVRMPRDSLGSALPRAVQERGRFSADRPEALRHEAHRRAPCQRPRRERKTVARERPWRELDFRSGPVHGPMGSDLGHNHGALHGGPVSRIRAHVAVLSRLRRGRERYRYSLARLRDVRGRQYCRVVGHVLVRRSSLHTGLSHLFKGTLLRGLVHHEHVVLHRRARCGVLEHQLNLRVRRHLELRLLVLHLVALRVDRHRLRAAPARLPGRLARGLARGPGGGAASLSAPAPAGRYQRSGAEARNADHAQAL